MFGTVGICKVKEENKQKIIDVFEKYGDVKIPGYRGVEIMFPENRKDEMIIVVWFEDRESYFKNANDPEQDKRYQEYRALMDGDPEWHDGDWIHGPWGKY